MYILKLITLSTISHYCLWWKMSHPLKRPHFQRLPPSRCFWNWAQVWIRNLAQLKSKTSNRFLLEMLQAWELYRKCFFVGLALRQLILQWPGWREGWIKGLRWFDHGTIFSGASWGFFFRIFYFGSYDVYGCGAFFANKDLGITSLVVPLEGQRFRWTEAYSFVTWSVVWASWRVKHFWMVDLKCVDFGKNRFQGIVYSQT